jgi:hypothetical protein
MKPPDVLRKVSYSLSDDGQLMNHSAPNHPVRLEGFKMLTLHELLDRLGGDKDVFEVEAFTPHR